VQFMNQLSDASFGFIYFLAQSVGHSNTNLALFYIFQMLFGALIAYAHATQPRRPTFVYTALACAMKGVCILLGTCTILLVSSSSASGADGSPTFARLRIAGGQFRFASFAVGVWRRVWPVHVHVLGVIQWLVLGARH
jgi:hypothetical protein